MTYAGAGFIARIALFLVTATVASVFYRLVGRGKRRGRVMAIGTVGGITAGVLVSPAVSRYFQTETSALCAVIGMQLGWCVAWRFARRIPREDS